MAVTFVLMPVLLRFCRKRGLFDMPNSRKVHQNHIPRLGGTLFVPAMLAGMFAVGALSVCEGDNYFSLGFSSVLMFVALTMIYIIGLIDDVLGLDAKVKFAIQFVAAAFMPVCNLYINNLYGFCGIYELPVWVGYPLTMLIALTLINAINLIDGIDGLSSGLGVIALGVFSYLFIQLGAPVFAVFSLGLAGSLVAFMYYNLFGSAERFTKTFMGDTGSLVLGFSLTYLCIKYCMFNPCVFPSQGCPILVSFTLVAVPVFDLVRVAVSRLCQGKGMFTPDKTHIHHLCLSAGMTMRRALVCVLLLQLAIDGVNLLLFKGLGVGSTLIVVSDVALYALTIDLLNKKTHQRRKHTLSTHDNPTTAVG